MYEIRKIKNDLRREVRQRRDAITKEEKILRDTKICNSVISLASFRYAESVLLYSPVASEINVDPIAKEALRRGKTVAYPISYHGGIMEYHTVTSLDELKEGKFGIPAPDESAPVFNGDTKNALVVIPAFLFDRKGYRIGYGGGFYDRYLSKFCGTKLGVIYSDFIVDTVPRSRYDISADILVCEKGVTVTNEG